MVQGHNIVHVAMKGKGKFFGLSLLVITNMVVTFSHFMIIPLRTF